ncbi:MAG: hypothetical protein ACR2NP_11265 [Pirellulaceae bacterium]
MLCRNSGIRRWRVFCLTSLAAIAFSSLNVSTALALDDKHKRGGHRGNSHGRHHHGGHHHGGKSFVSITPHGLSYGFYDGNFGIEIGPLFGGAFHNGYGHHGNYGPGYGYVDPPPSAYLTPAPAYGVAPAVPLVGAQPTPALAPSVAPSRVPGSTAPSAPAQSVLRTSGSATLVPVSPTAQSWQQQAEQAFRQQRYEEAVRMSRHASVEDGNNGLVFLFGSQAGFAAGRYDIAYDALARATELLPFEQWSFVIDRYRQLYSNRDYIAQMDQLGQFTKDNPQASFPVTVRGFHYAQLGHTEAARQDLQAALKRNPEDVVARRLLDNLRETLPEPSTAQAPIPSLDQ